MDIFKNGDRPSGKGPADYFTGSVRMDPIMEQSGPGGLRALVVTFEPGARTAWHTHPAGQTLYVLSGSGLVQKWGEPVQQIKPGDTVWFEPGEKHWHGAGPSTAMCHIAMQQAQDGSPADWLEKVSDDEYNAG